MTLFETIFETVMKKAHVLTSTRGALSRPVAILEILKNKDGKWCILPLIDTIF